MIKMTTLALALAACGATAKPLPPSNTEQRPPIQLEWRAAQAEDTMVAVTLVVDGKPVPIGQLDATSDGGDATPATCAIAQSNGARTELSCGGTPAYNAFVAALVGSELVVSKRTGVIGGESDKLDDEKQVEVKRIPVDGSALVVAPYQLPATSAPASDQ